MIADWSIVSREPVETRNGIPYFGSAEVGDQFTDEDVALWTTGGNFARRWNSRGTANEHRNAVYMDLCRAAATLNLPIVDIASGPALGLLPDIHALNPNLRALATDACPLVTETWREFLRANAPKADISFATFDAADMPIRDASADVITSSLGFSSLRYAGADNMLGVREAYRVLKRGGFVFSIENEHEDPQLVQRVFDLWGRENWFRANNMTWRERFETVGFKIEREIPHSRRVADTDWELGEVAASFGLHIAVKNTAYVLRKP
ncbi:MAG: class I SAM-dependent methyltransferase [Oscillospiraceae bacterium]|jgi:ubiquinone/menaquinone biosynthesis C-methylase UbiE|nr:class I SAM-dependent methyltransferase [Oscillospiraceae bacterium]